LLAVPRERSMPEMQPLLILDSVTVFGPEARGRVVCGGSHGGIYAAYLCARAGVAAVLLNDAGMGLGRAGIAGIDWLEGPGVPAAALSHRSCRIGDGADALARGVISHANRFALALGVVPGMRAGEALERLGGATPAAALPPERRESRHTLPIPGATAIDSASLLTEADRGAIAIIGSHGGLLGGRPETAAKVDVFAALFNDADGGMDGAGYTRLPALEARGIAAGTLSAWTARIGDGMSGWETGVVSALNATARRYGARLGDPAKDFVEAMHAARGTR
jgi:hypothetical protein